MSTGMLGLENSNPSRKLQFVVLDLQLFGFEKGPGPNAPSSPPRIAVFVEDWQCQTALFGLPVPNSPAVPWSLKTDSETIT